MATNFPPFLFSDTTTTRPATPTRYDARHGAIGDIVEDDTTPSPACPRLHTQSTATRPPPPALFLTDGETRRTTAHVTDHDRNPANVRLLVHRWYTEATKRRRANSPESGTY